MADKKISALTAATTPLDGTEVLPIVQSGATKKVANNDLRPRQIQSNATSGVLQIVGPAAAATRVMTTPDANFTVARTDAANSFSGNQTLSDGNLVVGTAGKGIDFSANAHAAGMTSELLNDYEEGDFTPALTVASGSLTYAVQGTPRYTKIGRLVNAYGYINVSSVNLPSGALTITGLPYASFGYAAVTLTLFTGGFTQAYSGYLSNGGTTISIPNLSANIMVGGENIMFNATYTV